MEDDPKLAIPTEPPSFDDEPSPNGLAGTGDDRTGPGGSQFLYHLQFEHLRNLTTLSVSATGGGLLALQAGLLDFDGAVEAPLARAILTALPLLCFAFASVLALLTQRTLIRDLATHGAPSKAFGIMSESANALFGAGVGSAASILLMLRFL